MADGFVVAARDEEANTTQYWNGSVLQEDFQAAAFYTDKTTARLASGAIQSQYPELEVSLQSAAQVLQLGTAGNVPTNSPRNVAVPAATPAQVRP
jgi:hypothetical protein